MMTEVRTQYLALATERASSPEKAEIAVSLVMAAFGRTMHDQTDSDLPLAERLKKTITQLTGVLDEQLV